LYISEKNKLFTLLSGRNKKKVMAKGKNIREFLIFFLFFFFLFVEKPKKKNAF